MHMSQPRRRPVRECVVSTRGRPIREHEVEPMVEGRVTGVRLRASRSELRRQGVDDLEVDSNKPDHRHD